MLCFQQPNVLSETRRLNMDWQQMTTATFVHAAPILAHIANMLDLPATASFRGFLNTPLYLIAVGPDPAHYNINVGDTPMNLASQWTLQKELHAKFQELEDGITALAITEQQVLQNIDDLQEYHRTMNESLRILQDSRDEAGQVRDRGRVEIAELENRMYEHCYGALALDCIAHARPWL